MRREYISCRTYPVQSISTLHFLLVRFVQYKNKTGKRITLTCDKSASKVAANKSYWLVTSLLKCKNREVLVTQLIVYLLSILEFFFHGIYFAQAGHLCKVTCFIFDANYYTMRIFLSAQNYFSSVP